jgi:predicted nucleic-acid-binding protein
MHIEGDPSVEQALFIWKDSAAESGDCLIGMLQLEPGCQATASFDQRAIKLPGFIAA